MVLHPLFAAIISQDDVNIPTDPDVTADTFTKVLNIMFPIVGAIAFIILLLAAFKYVRSRGNPTETAKAKNTIIYAVIGLIVTILAYPIITFVVSQF